MDWLYLILLGAGALGGLVFVADYLRTADLDLPYTRLMITMNMAISGILWIAVLRQLGVIESTPFWRWVRFSLFLVVDITIWYQVYLLYRIRGVSKKIFVKKQKRDRIFKREHERIKKEEKP